MKDDQVVRLHIKVREPFDFDECLWFLHRGYDECLYRIQDHQILRLVEFENGCAVLKICEQDDHIIVEETGMWGQVKEHEIRRFVGDWFDVERDLQPFYQCLEQHPALSYLTGQFWGLRLMRIPSFFEAISWCIIGQQINLQFAYLLKRRLVEYLGRTESVYGHQLWHFPRPTLVRDCSRVELGKMQFSRQKIRYLQEIAEAVSSGLLAKEKCASLGSREDRLQYLQSFKGIGPWTANYVLMKCFADMEAVPHGDAGLLSALTKHKLIHDRKDEDSLVALFDQFDGYQAYLVQYLWRSLAIK